MKDIKKLIALWNKQCSSTKIILFIGFACLMNMVISTLLGSTNFPENNTAIKSILSSIFGYVFGKHCIPSKFGHEEIQTITGGLVAIICLAALFITNWMHLDPSLSGLSEIRDLLLLAVGFLISKAKNEGKSCL